MNMHGVVERAIKEAREGDYDLLISIATFADTPEAQRLLCEAEANYDQSEANSARFSAKIDAGDLF